MHAASFHQLLTSTDPAAIAIIRIVNFEPPAGFELVRFRTPVDWRELSAGMVRRAELIDPEHGAIDDIVVSVVSTPDRNNRDQPWEIWLHLHGGPGITRRCCELLQTMGIPELSEKFETPLPTTDYFEFDCLSRLPEMKTQAGVQWLLAQPRKARRLLERLRKRAVREPRLVARASDIVRKSRQMFDWYATPVRIALVGPPNAGKSTLINALAGIPVSITSDTPGTTRDWIEAPGEIRGFPVIWIDTAGQHDTDDPLDQAGIAASRAAAATAELRVGVFDVSDPGLEREIRRFECHSLDLRALNKSDLALDLNMKHIITNKNNKTLTCVVSAIKMEGLSHFESYILQILGRDQRRISRATAFSASVECSYATLG